MKYPTVNVNSETSNVILGITHQKSEEIAIEKYI